MTLQWVMMLLGMHIVKSQFGNDIAGNIHCDITMSNDIAICTYHCITMHNEYVFLHIFFFMPNYDFIMGSM